MSQVRVGIIGVGSMGSAHLSTISSGAVKNLQLTAACDLNPERLEFAKEHCPQIACYLRWQELVADPGVDAVIIAVPHRLHSDIAMAALEAGKHVLTEKPVDIRVSKALQLNECARKSDRVFGIMFNQRTDSLFQKAREIVRGGLLGELKRTVWIITNWYRTQAYYDSGSWRATWGGEGGGVLLNQAPHQLDLWQWICGMPVQVTAFCDVAKYHRIEVEDDVTILTRYENGATGTFITTTGEYPGTNRLEISGTLGKLVLENGKLKWWKLPLSERELCVTCQDGSSNLEPEYQLITPTDSGVDGHTIILQNWTDAIVSGTPLLAPGIEGVGELTLSNAAYLSAWNGNVPVSLPLDTAAFDRALDERIAVSCYQDAPPPASSPDGTYKSRWSVQW